jgi:hypothetical protein
MPFAFGKSVDYRPFGAAFPKNAAGRDRAGVNGRFHSCYFPQRARRRLTLLPRPLMRAFDAPMYWAIMSSTTRRRGCGDAVDRATHGVAQTPD